MRISLLVNEASGSYDPDSLDACLLDDEAVCTKFGLDRLDDALACKPDRLAVAGGDGSIGFAAAKAAEAGVPLALLPTGTANDFARLAGIPTDLPSAGRIVTGSTRVQAFDLAWVNDTPFVNVASGGLAVKAAHKAHGLKKVLGPAAYFVGAIAAARQAQPFECEVQLDDQEQFVGQLWQIIVANSGAFGWGAQVDARLGDDTLDVLLLKAGSKLWFPLRAIGMRSGKLGKQTGVIHTRSKTATLLSPKPLKLNVDGELVDVGTEARFRLERAAFQLVLPAQPD